MRLFILQFLHIKEIFISLIRCESDVKEWNKSKLSYKLCKLDNNFNILSSNLCLLKLIMKYLQLQLKEI